MSSTDSGNAPDLMSRVLAPVAAGLGLTAALIAFTPMGSDHSKTTGSEVTVAALTSAASTAVAETAAAPEADSDASDPFVVDVADAAVARGSSDGTGTTAGATAAPTQVASTDFSGEQRSAIEQIVRGYLLENPEILIEMQTVFEARQAQAQEAQMAQVLASQGANIFRATGAPVGGNPDGDVTVVEFFDYNCGFCRRALTGVTDLINQDDNVKVVFKELPIFGEDSEAAARAALAAKKQGKYWEMHRDLLEKPGRANGAKGRTIAEDLGLDMAQFDADLEADDVVGEIARVRELANAMGIRGTPHFLIDDQVIPGAPEDLVDQLKTRIASIRESGGCKVC